MARFLKLDLGDEDNPIQTTVEAESLDALKTPFVQASKKIMEDLDQ